MLIDRGNKYKKTRTITYSVVLCFSILGIALWNLLPVKAQGSVVNLGRNFRPDPMKLQGSTSGSVRIADIAGIQANCRGYANSQPNYVIQLKDNFPVMDMLVYTNEVKDDPTMLVKGPNGLVICADDEYRGHNPQLYRRFPEGIYQIWIGSSETNKSIQYTLSLSEIRQK